MKAKFTTTRKIFSFIVLMGLLVSAFALAFPSGTAAAASLAQEPQPTTNADKSPTPARLEKTYQRELELLKTQAVRLDRLDERADKFAARIAKLKDEGKDATVLEKALTDFKAKIMDARSQHEEAAKILNTHSGFDANGKVTDVSQASETVKDAGKMMREIHQDLRPTIREMVKALRQFIRDNRGK
jgi:hypothetical protein